ncbi:hypothetical protein QAD02_013908 [Eretmocerus hayati]|uniref:Uncharacterized protein n=1 Tax=Eretmocerus hayati TaxID=131215 RepID=A0ACC2P520_9HYME|nr:hypothetical protein QAD02_013908 [Eretmocerus hayati]
MSNSPESNPEPPGQDPPNENSDDDDSEIQEPEEDKFALAKFYRYEAGIPQTNIIPTKLVHKFNPEDPLTDYLVPRQDGKGLITHEPTQILKVAKSRQKLKISNVEPLNPKRRNMKKGYHSDIYKDLIKRDGPIADEDHELVNRNGDEEAQSEEGNDSDNHEDENQAVDRNADEVAQHSSTNGYNHVDPKAQAPKKVRKQRSKKVPRPKTISAEDMAILEYQAQEMPGIDINIDEEEESREMKIRLIKSESSRIELESKVSQLHAEKRIQDELIERLAERVEQLEKNSEQNTRQGARRILTMDFGAPSMSQHSGLHSHTSESHRSRQETSQDSGMNSHTREAYRSRQLMKTTCRREKKSRKDVANLTPSDDTLYKSYEKYKPLEKWTYKYPVTGVEVIN